MYKQNKFTKKCKKYRIYWLYPHAHLRNTFAESGKIASEERLINVFILFSIIERSRNAISSDNKGRDSYYLPEHIGNALWPSNSLVALSANVFVGTGQ